jgi:hypothetical protein
MFQHLQHISAGIRLNKIVLEDDSSRREFTSCSKVPSAIESSAGSWGIIVWKAKEGKNNIINGRASSSSNSSSSHARKEGNSNEARRNKV